MGYPLEDVRGFRINGGSGCKLCGYWKVYGDVEKAKVQFEVYDKCRAFMCGQIKQDVYKRQCLLCTQLLCCSLRGEYAGCFHVWKRACDRRRPEGECVGNTVSPGKIRRYRAFDFKGIFRVVRRDKNADFSCH